MSSNASINPYTKKPYSENYSTLLKSRRNLPVYQSMPEILKAVKENTVVVLVGETGSGKTTQLPPELISSLPAGKKISLTQNRRLAVDMVNDSALLRFYHSANSIVIRLVLESQRKWTSLSVPWSEFNIGTIETLVLIPASRLSQMV